MTVHVITVGVGYDDAREADCVVVDINRNGSLAMYTEHQVRFLADQLLLAANNLWPIEGETK